MPVLLALVLAAAEPASMGIALEELSYPAPVKFLELTLEGRPERMAYMDVPAVGPEKSVPVLLLHGKNFDSGTWAGTIDALNRAGRRTTRVEFPGVGHAPHLEAPQEFQAALLPFLVR